MFKLNFVWSVIRKQRDSFVEAAIYELMEG